ncbi:MAG: HlyD family efflux transporter periplasmic adaptor subunit [Nevskia sp.]|nr:HlyD family efflux transporter periplasmic adaptor subunit [Nevskia sp.]
MKVRFVKPEASDPERDRGIRVPYAPGKRALARWRWYLILLVVSSPFLFFAINFLYSSVLILAPGFVSQEQLTIRSASQGYVDEVYVKTLDAVKEGDPVARLANEALTTHAAQLRAELKELQGVAAQFHGTTSAPLSTESFQDELETARQERARLAQRVNSIQQLVEQGAATEAELNTARSQYDQASSRLGELYRTMNIQTQPVHHGTGIEVQTRILAIQTELASIDTQEQAMLVRAPKGGRIVDLAVVKGDQLTVGSKVAMLAPEGGEMHIDAYIPPKNAIYATPGLYGTVVFPDGSRRQAVIADVPQVATEVPKAQSALLGQSEMGVLVRMQMLDAGQSGQHALTDGLPVKVEFANGWDLQSTRRFVVQMQHYWDDVWDRFLPRRA